MEKETPTDPTPSSPSPLTKSLTKSGTGCEILFFNVPLHGHVNPTLDLVDELVKRGHRVTYYTSENFKEKIDGIGATFESYGNTFNFTLTRDISNIFHTAREMLLAAEAIMEYLHPKLVKKHFDLIMYDVSAVWGKFLCEILKIPSICCFPGLAPQWKGYLKSKTLLRGMKDSLEGFWDMQETRQIRDRIIGKYNIQKINSSQLFAGSKVLNVVFTSPYLQPYGAEMIDRFLFIGPTLQARKESVTFPFDQLNPKYPLVYISMGTLYKPDISFFKTCFQAFKDKHFNVIISVGKSTAVEDLEPIPDNVFVKQYVPQLAVLERTQVFVSHGGMGGINEAMFYTVPMVILPKTIEQQVNALRIEELGAGINLQSQEVTAEQMFAGVEKILSDLKYNEATKKISKSFRETGGIIPAVDFIEKVLSEEGIDRKKLKEGQSKNLKEKEKEREGGLAKRKSLRDVVDFRWKKKDDEKKRTNSLTEFSKFEGGEKKEEREKEEKEEEDGKGEGDKGKKVEKGEVGHETERTSTERKQKSKKSKKGETKVTGKEKGEEEKEKKKKVEMFFSSDDDGPYQQEDDNEDEGKPEGKEKEEEENNLDKPVGRVAGGIFDPFSLIRGDGQIPHKIEKSAISEI